MASQTQATLSHSVRLKAPGQKVALDDSLAYQYKRLSEATRLLSSSLNYRQTLRNLAKILVPDMADWFGVDLLQADGSLHSELVFHSDAVKVRWARQLRKKFPPDPQAVTGVPQVIRSSTAEYYPVISEDLWQASGISGEQMALIKKVGISSILIVPLNCRQKTLGAITLVWAESGLHYSVDDKALIEELANRIALAIDNARLYDAAQQEIERRKQAEEQTILLNKSLEQRVDERTRSLRESEQRFAAAMGSIQEGIVLQAEDGSIIMGNAAAARILGRSQDDMIRLKPSDLAWQAVWPNGDGCPPAERPSMVALRTGQSQRNVLLGIVQPVGEVAWVSINSTPLFHAEARQPYAVVSTYVDVTESLKLEEERMQYALELERSNRELQDFASVASHDLQEPLRKIRAFGDRLQSGSGQDLSPERQDYLQRMQSAAERMQRLINDLLTYSRVTTKAEPFSLVDLNAVVSEVLSDLEASIEDNRGIIEVGDLPTIEADSTQMRQLLQNLIGNGLKFHHPDQPARIQISAEVDSTHPARAQCLLRVHDDGIGLDPKYTDRIFQVFQRLHGQDQYSGTGVGLAVVDKIVDRHRGEIDVESAPGQGATFIITLPIHQQGDLT